MRPDLTRLRMLLETTGSRGVVIAENSESAASFLQQGFRAWSFATSQVLRWSSASNASPPRYLDPSPTYAVRLAEEDMSAPRARSPDPQGDAHRRAYCSGLQESEIALRLKTTEQ